MFFLPTFSVMSTQNNNKFLFCSQMLTLSSKFAKTEGLEVSWMVSFLSLNFLVQQVIERNQSPTDWQFWQLLFSGCQCIICYSPSQIKTEQGHMLCQSHSSDLAPGPLFPSLALFYFFPVSCQWSAFKFRAIVKLPCLKLEAGLELIFSGYYYSTFTVESPALQTNRAS